MNIRPVDSQVNMNRAAEINRVTNNDGSRAESQNAQFANSFQKATREAEVEVSNSSKTENPRLKKDKDKDQKNKRNRNKNKNDNKDEEKSLLDIKI